MARLEFDDYLRHLRTESARFREVLSECDPRARVPSCPDWRAADLLWHLGGVQHFWGSIVIDRPTGPDDHAEPSRPDSYADLLAHFDEASIRLCDALAAADPTEEAWTWSQEHTVGFVHRRQAHEALIHRLDAELTLGREVTALDPALAADGVEECLDLMYGGCPPWGHFSALPHHVRVHITDRDESVWVQLGRFSGTDPDGVHHDEDDLHVVPDPGSEADAVISGPAAALDAWLWRRRDDTGVRVSGDRTMYDHFRSVVSQPIN
jgi:uncharacterized protein (TIGR03083 family)